MVYIIRHKGFWEFAPGRGYYDQNFHSFIKMIEPPQNQTLYLARKNTSYFPFRFLHLYRTLKRATNQFLQGNQYFENSMTMLLRNMFTKVPTELFQKNGGADMFIHKGERHWELMTYNTHPIQHDFYELANEYCAENFGEHKERDQRYNDMAQRIVEACEEKKKKLGLEDHETLDINDIQEAFDQEFKKERARKDSQLYVKTQSEKDADFDRENKRRPSYFY